MNGPIKAIILFSDGPENDEISKWYTKEIAGIPLYKRALLSACKAGVKELILFDCRIKDEIKGVIESDPRINAHVKWCEQGTNKRLDKVVAREFAENPDNHIFIIKPNVLFDYRILNTLTDEFRDNAIAALPAGPETSNARTFLKNNIGNSKIRNELNDGILIVSRKVKDFLSTDGDFSLQSLTERLNKEGLVNKVEIQDLVYEKINTQDKLQLAERKLYQSLGTSCDSPILDKRVIRKISGAISRLTIKTAVTPNQITIFSLILGILTGIFFSFGNHTYTVVAGFLYFISVVFDQCDGEVARLKHLESKSGHVLDIMCDTVVNVALVIGITIGSYKIIGHGYVFLVGLLAIVGITISLLLVTYFEEKIEGKTHGKTKEALDKLNNKDFFYIIIIICVITNQMIWFLLVMAIGTNIYWIMRKIAMRKS